MYFPVLVTVIFLFVSTLTTPSAAAAPETEKPMKAGIEIPKSLQIEHGEIHAKLVEATRAPGRVGEAARKLAEVLHPHFVREEEIALPPLGLLQPLAAGAAIPEERRSEALAMTDSLKRELPRMLEEHGRIRAAVEQLRLAATAEKATEYERLADQLALHAQSEEEVFYPAAILVGEAIRARTNKD